MKNATTFSPHSTKFLTVFTPLYWAAVLTAYFLLSRDWAIVRATAASQEHFFGLFGFCVFFAILYCAYTDYRSLPVHSARSLMMIGVPIFVALFLLVHVAELSKKSWDYNQYETAFRAVVAGENPYLSTRYLYPPFFAQVMVTAYRAGTWLLPLMGGSAISLWTSVFYIHQSGLLFALLLSYYLALRFADMAGLKPWMGLLFVSGLFLFNVPLLRTILYNQVNFYILVSILVTILVLNRYPFISGSALAIGGLIKLYPFALAAPLLATRKWKALAGILVGVLAILAIQTKAFRNLTLWKQFVLFYLSFPVERESAWFRNSSILSFLRNSLEFMGAPPGAVLPVFGLAALLILGWMALRFLQREKLYRYAIKQSLSSTHENEIFRNAGHLVDFSVLSLLIAPSAWEHHYVIAIPLAIWAFSLTNRKDLPLLTIGLIFVFVMPVFNIFPFSYLRMAGLILLLALASPKEVEQVFHK